MKKCNIIHEDNKPDKIFDNSSSTYPPLRLQQPISSLYLINLNILTWFWSRTCSCTINPGCPPKYYPQANYNMEILSLFEKFMPSRKYPSSIIEKKAPDFPVFGSLLSKQLTRHSALKSKIKKNLIAITCLRKI